MLTTHSFQRSGASVRFESDTGRFRLETDSVSAGTASTDDPTTFEDMPEDLLHGYRIPNPPGEGFVFAYGRLPPTNRHREAAAARQHGDAFPLLARDPGVEPAEDEWQAVPLMCFETGLWVAEVPGWCQWLRLGTEGEQRVFFRPSRPLPR